MARRICIATGNLTSASTWADTNSTAELLSQANNTALTTSYVESASFTPGAITIDAIAVWIASRAASPSGTMSVRLAQGGVTVAGTEVTINVSDLPLCTTTEDQGGFALFKFAAPVTLLAATAYTVSAKTSSSTQVNLYRDATAGNWSRMLRTTTTGTPGTWGLHILKELTGAGTSNTFTVTNDNTTTGSYSGPGSGALGITIGDGCTLQSGTSAATNYFLGVDGHLVVHSGGTLSLGTSATPIPRDSTAVLEIFNSLDGANGLQVKSGGTFNAQGLSRTSAKNIVSCKLNTDEAAGQTTLGVDADTGWKNGDTIVIASTTRTASQTEARTLNADAGASSLSVSAGLTNAHSGTSPTQAEVILLNRNVIIRSSSSLAMTYCYFGPTATVDIDWAQFYYLGENAATKRGLEIATTTGSFNMQYSSIHDCEDWGIYVSSASGSNITISNNVFYNLNTAIGASTSSIYFATSTGVTTFTNNIGLLLYSATNGAVELVDVGLTFTGNTFQGASASVATIRFSESNVIGTFSNNTIHSFAGYGVVSASSVRGIATITNLTVWRGNNVGLYINSSTSGLQDITLDNLQMWGNTTSNMGVTSFLGKIIIINSKFNGDTTFSTTNGLNLASGGAIIKFNNCNFGTASGILTTHTNDINISSAIVNGLPIYINFNNSILASGTEVATQANMANGDDYISSAKHDQTAGNHKTWKKYGTIQSDSTYFNTASPSERLTPNNASNKLQSGSKKVAVASGNTVTINAYVRKSTVASGGALYNGNQPRLILKQNDAAGITADTVIDTMTEGATANWEQLTGTTASVTDDAVLEFIVDCDGTTGFVNVDDWTVS